MLKIVMATAFAMIMTLSSQSLAFAQCSGDLEKNEVPVEIVSESNPVLVPGIIQPSSIQRPSG